MMSWAVRPDRYSELIAHLCMFQLEVRGDRYPNAEFADRLSRNTSSLPLDTMAHTHEHMHV